MSLLEQYNNLVNVTYLQGTKAAEPRGSCSQAGEKKKNPCPERQLKRIAPFTGEPIEGREHNDNDCGSNQRSQV